MLTLDTDVVSTLRWAIAERIGQDRFELWFGAGSQLVRERDRVRIEAGNSFTLDWLRHNFRKDIEAAVMAVLGEEIALEFRLNPLLEPRGARTPRDPSEKEGVEPRAVSAPNRPPRPVNAIAGRPYASLDSFIVGDGNRVAFTSAGSVVRQLGKVTPLFLYGPTGVGKTHLLEGICSDARRSLAPPKAVYLSAEQFTSYFLEALEGRGLPCFRRRYRDVDLLIIDDVQFVVGKRATQSELQYTVDSLLREGKQIVLAADRSPTQLIEFGPEFIARLCGGLVSAIHPPDYATRVGMLNSWVKSRNLVVPADVLELIAGRVAEDARQLQGALHRVQATSEALGEPITLPLANEALGDILLDFRRIYGLEEIERAVCGLFCLDRQTLKSSQRATSVSHPRMLAMWLARKYTRAALSEIGDFFGGRSHATVVSAQKTVSRWMKDGKSLQLRNRSCHVGETLRQLEARLRAG